MMNRSHCLFVSSLLLGVLFAWILVTSDLSAAEPAEIKLQETVGYKIQLDTIASEFKAGKGYEGKFCWAQARAGIVPQLGRNPLVVVTASPLRLAGVDVYYDLHEFRSTDFGKTWLGPFAHDKTLNRRNTGIIDGEQSVTCPGDFWPKWHAKSGKILGTGQTMQYIGDIGVVKDRKRQVCYSSYDATTHEWSTWDAIKFDDADLSYSCGAGCTQRVDLPNGDILLPVYWFPNGKDIQYRSTVLRCQFDGAKLKCVERGKEIRIAANRGAYEPSLTKFGDKFFLTIRNDDTAYVTTSDDGLYFDKPREWTWDDDRTPLGSYNTQAHWVTHSNGLFLVYTRKGANNDEIARHRAPLFIAEVDPVKLNVKRKSEKILIPKNGSRYGNNGIVCVNENETWVIECEWMQTNKPRAKQVDRSLTKEEAPNATGRIYAARIIWDKPNLLWDKL